MKNLFKRILSTVAAVATMLTVMPLNAQAATTVAAPMASKKSGTYYTSYCEHSSNNPGYHYYYTIGGGTTYKSSTAVKSSRQCFGNYESLIISLSSNTSGATIYFDAELTNNNTSWSEGARKTTGLKYTKPIELTQDTKITAYAMKNGVKSESVTYTYKVCSRIELSHEGGTYDEPISIQITSNGGPLKGYVYYTTDGSKPTEKSNKTITRESTFSSHAYIDITESCTLRMLIDPGPGSGKSSYYLTEKYVIKNGSSNVSASGNSDNLYDYENKYYYNTLNSTQKKAYAAMFKSAKSGRSASSAGYDLSNSQNAELWTAFREENPQFLYKIMNDTTSLQTVSELNKLEKAAAEIIEDAEKLNSYYDKVKLFHDEVANATIYSLSTNYHQTAYGALVSGKAACRGYANAFAYLCQSAGIDCILVSGYVNNNVAHSWNMVKLDGNWYHVDVCWDDVSKIRYNYFLVSDSSIKKDHIIDTNVDVPTASKNYSKSNTTPTTDKDDDKNSSATTTTEKPNSSNSSVIDTRLLEPNVLDLAVGSRVKLSYLFNKVDGVSFSSSDKSVAKIVKTSSGTHHVKGVGEGEATITAKYKGETAKINVYVVDINDENSKFSLSAKKSVYVGKTIKITAKIDTTTDEYITWVIPNKKYFEVVASSGDNSRYITLKALKKGTAKVYAITSTGDVKTISITIK